jgi:hypothetical protein
MFKFESRIVHFIFPLSLFRLENHVCLSRVVQVVDADLAILTLPFSMYYVIGV